MFEFFGRLCIQSWCTSLVSHFFISKLAFSILFFFYDSSCFFSLKTCDVNTVVGEFAARNELAGIDVSVRVGAFNGFLHMHICTVYFSLEQTTQSLREIKRCVLNLNIWGLYLKAEDAEMATKLSRSNYCRNAVNELDSGNLLLDAGMQARTSPACF